MVHLKDVFQRELKDSGFSGRTDLSKEIIVHGRVRRHRPETVRKVERFSAEFETLAFAELEHTRERRVKLPRRWTGNAVTADVPKGSQRRLCECGRTQAVRQRPA